MTALAFQLIPMYLTRIVFDARAIEHRLPASFLGTFYSTFYFPLHVNRMQKTYGVRMIRLLGFPSLHVNLGQKLFILLKIVHFAVRRRLAQCCVDYHYCVFIAFFEVAPNVGLNLSTRISYIVARRRNTNQTSIEAQPRNDKLMMILYATLRLCSHYTE